MSVVGPEVEMVCSRDIYKVSLWTGSGWMLSTRDRQSARLMKTRLVSTDGASQISLPGVLRRRQVWYNQLLIADQLQSADTTEYNTNSSLSSCQGSKPRLGEQNSLPAIHFRRQN